MIHSRNRERSEFTEEEGQTLLAQAQYCVQSALQKKPLPPFNDALAEAPVVGVFVSLKRGKILRACCGSLNEKESAPLGELLMAAAYRSAMKDIRFPRIMREELPHLDIEVSVMHDMEVMPEDPNLRINQLTIGKHGLIISDPKGRGLLLPQVASENNWDAPQFLERVCLKASLPPDSWLRPGPELKKFSASIFHQKPSARDIDFRELPSSVNYKVIEFAEKILQKGAKAADQMPEQLKMAVSPGGWGLLLQTTGQMTEMGFATEGSLGKLILEVARKLHQPGKAGANKIREMIALSHPISLHPADYPARFGTIQPGFAVTARRGTQTSLALKKGASDPVGLVLKQMNATPKTWPNAGIQLQCHLALNWARPEKITHVSPPPEDASSGIRPSAVAGKFYPGSVEEMQKDLKAFFAACDETEKIKVRAVMLPHAGWKFCGDIIAETLEQVEIPDTVVIVGPKHTPLGANWAVSRAKNWRIPGAEVKLDEESASWFAAHVAKLEKDELAHQKEHGIEVIVPFLHHLNPDVQIVPIVVGSGTYEDFVELGDQMKTFRERLTHDGDDCLFIISSDMNHFANDKENRRLDKMALDAFVSGDTRRLFDTCNQNKISMCGMRPAVAVISSLGLDHVRLAPDIGIVRYETSARVTKDTSKVVGYAGAILK